MSKLWKILTAISILIVICCCFVFFYVILPHYKDLSRLKPDIENQLSRFLNAEVVINGYLSTNFFSNSLLIIHDVQLKSKNYTADIHDIKIPITKSFLLQGGNIENLNTIYLNKMSLKINYTTDNLVQTIFNDYNDIPLNIIIENSQLKTINHEFSDIKGNLYKNNQSDIIFQCSTKYHNQLYDFVLSKDNTKNKLSISNQSVNANLLFKYINNTPVGSGDFNITTPDFFQFLTSQLNINNLNFQFLKKPWKMSGHINNDNEHNDLILSDLQITSSELSTTDGSIIIFKDKKIKPMLKFKMNFCNFDSIIPMDNTTQINNSLKLLNKYNVVISGLGNFIIKKLPFDNINFNSVSNDNNVVVNSLKISNKDMSVNFAGNVSVKNNFNIDNSHLEIVYKNFNTLESLNKFSDFIKIPVNISVSCNFSGNLSDWKCEDFTFTDMKNIIHGDISHSVKNTDLNVNSAMLDLDNLLQDTSNNFISNIDIINDKFNTSWNINLNINKLKLNNIIFDNINTKIVHNKDSFKILQPISYILNNIKTSISGEIIKKNKNWNYNNFLLELYDTKLSSLVFLPDVLKKLPLQFLNSPSFIKAQLNGNYEKPDSNLDLKNDSISLNAQTSNNSVNFDLTVSDFHKFISDLVPDLDTYIIKPNLTCSMSGKLMNNKIDNLSVKINNHLFTGTLDFNNHTILDLKTDNLNIDSFLNKNIDMDTLNFRTSPIYISLLNIPDFEYSVKSDFVVFNDSFYNNFNLSLNTNLSEPIEQISVASSNNKTFLGEIIKQNDLYRIKLQADDFYIPLLKISPKANLNIEQTNMNLNAIITTYGFTQYDILHNLNGNLNMEFENGYITGFGFDKFYNTNLNSSNIEYELYNMLNSGKSKFEMLNIFANVKNGELISSEKFNFVSKLVSIQGNFVLKNHELYLNSDIVLDKTAIKPSPFHFNIRFDGSKQFSIEQIKQNIDVDFMNFYRLKN